mgnify:FL=1
MFLFLRNELNRVGCILLYRMFPEKFVRNFSRLFHCSIIKVPTEKPLFSVLCDVFKKLFSRSSAINTLSHLVVFVNTFFNFFFSRCFVRLIRTSYILPKISIFVNNFFQLFSTLQISSSIANFILIFFIKIILKQLPYI